MVFTRRFSGLLLLALAGWASVAPAEAEKSPTSQAVLAAEFDLTYWPPLVPVQFQGREHAFLLDTGSTYSIYDSYFQDRLGPPVSEEKASTPGGQITVVHYSSPAAKLGRIDLSGEDKVACMDMQAISAHAGMGVRGLLGVSSFRRHVLQLDFDENQVRVFEPDGAAHPEWGTAVNMVLTRQRVPSVEVEVDGVTSWLVVDTGSKSFLSLPEKAFVRAMGEEKRKTAEIVISTLGGARHERVARFKKVSLGGMVHENALVAEEGVSGRLGYDYLRRFIVTMDFPAGKMYLKKGSRFDEPIEIDMSGMSLAMERDIVIVKHVEDNLPAALAGVKKEDELVKIDGKRISRMPMEEIRCILQGGDGKTVMLTLRRRHDLVEVPLVLKRRI